MYLYLVILFILLVLYIYLLFYFFIFLFKIKNGSFYLHVENLNFGIDECDEFNPFEDEENPNPTSNPQSVHSSNSDHVGKIPRISERTSLV